MNHKEKRPVAVTKTILEVPDWIVQETRKKKTFKADVGEIEIPDEWTQKVFLADEEMTRTRGAKALACADIVITTRLPDGTPAVLASKRNKKEAFGGKWWMYGGGLSPYPVIELFVLDRAKKECGALPTLEACMGVYFTAADDVRTGTLQPCYVGSISYEAALKATTDENHSNFRLLTLKDLVSLPADEVHEYPLRMFEKALRTMPYLKPDS